MKLVISPAKSLNYTSELPTKEFTQSCFLKEAEMLNNILKNKSPRELEILINLDKSFGDLFLSILFNISASFKKQD